MALLTIELLGPPRIALAGGILTLRVRKELALLAYLAVEQQHRHSRETLVGLLWPDVPEEVARNNLRVVLAGLRRLLGEAGDACLHADRQHVQFLPESDYALDVITFRRLLADVRAHAHAAPDRCDACIARLAEAVELYRGDFLAGFSLPDGAPFEEWATIEREQLHQQAFNALDTLTTAHELRGDRSAQIAYGRRQLALEPWRESAHAQVMRGLWASGQRGAALAQYEACRRILADELGVEPAPELAALAEQLRAVEAAPATRPVPPAAAPPHNLPAQLTSFIGRESEVNQLVDLLARPDCRLLTLVGPGGIGKTRLAIEVAGRHSSRFADGIFLVRLASLGQPDLVAAAITQALGLKTSGGQSPEAALVAWLGGKRLLLVLDNFEHLLDAAPLVAELLAGAPGLTVLATSREALNIYGEQRFLVPPLALPPRDLRPSDAGAAPVMAAEQHAAIALFVKRLQAVRPEFVLTPANWPAVAELCTRLDGLPLAIELAAARGQRLSPQRLLEQFQRGSSGLELLAVPARDRPLRQQTLHATIAWSYELLSDQEQILFRRLAVFAGGWTTEAAEAIAWAGDNLDALVDKSLVAISEEADGEPRFTMLETIREYALERLDERGETAALRERHAAFFLDLAEAAEPHLVSAQEMVWHGRLVAEEDNLRAALRWAVDGCDLERGLRLAAALGPFWDGRSSYSEGRGWLVELLAIDRPAREGAAYAAARARALNSIAILAFRQADMDAALAYAQEGLALCRALGNDWGAARALMTIGNVVGLGWGRFQEAAGLYEEALALQRRLNDRPGVSIALFNLGLMALAGGEYRRSRDWFEAAEQSYRAVGSDSGAERIQPYLAAAVLLGGDYEQAATLVEQALARQEGRDELDALFAAQTLLVAAGIADVRGDPAAAARLLGAVDGIDQSRGVRTRRLGAKRHIYETINAAVRAQLDEATFATARTAGAELTTAQALATARATVAPVASQQDRKVPAPVDPRDQLPAALTPLIGRERDLQALAALLKQPDVRLVTLVGLGGMGKTRLASHVAGELAGSYADGAWLVELAALSDPALAPQAVAAALGVREESGKPLDQVLVRNLQAKQLLLVLDNCEHLADACRSLAEQLLRACPELTILATSREVLQIAGEHVWPVPALAVPGAEVVAPALLVAHDSVRLFVERASAANPAFALNASNAPAVAQICRRLDGIPLAIELAAARVRHMTVEEIAARLDDRFALLTAGSPTAAPRQRTLRAAIDWSYDLLAAPEQALFRRLAVFAGGWTLQSAAAVCAVEHGDRRPATLELLSQLADKSLVIVEQRGNTTRYRLLETIRAYAHEWLADADELDVARERHLATFARLAEEAEPQLFAADQAAWLDHLTLEHDNLRAAIDYAISRADAPAALRLVTALRSFWYTRGHYEEGRQRILRALALPTAQAPTPARASALNAAGAVLWATGAAAEARQLLDEALAIGRAVGDPLNTGWARLHLGTIAYQQHDYPAAQPLLEAGLADCRAAGAAGRRGVGWALTFLGDLALYAGDAQQARARFEEGVALLRALADVGLLAYPLRRLGHLTLEQGDVATATACCTESLQLNLAIDDRLAVAACLAALAAVAVAAGQAAGGAAQTDAMRYAAHLCGAVTARLAIIGAPLWPADAAMLNATIAAAAAHLGESAFAAAAAEGSAIPLEQLIECGADWAQPGGVEIAAPMHHLPA